MPQTPYYIKSSSRYRSKGRSRRFIRNKRIFLIIAITVLLITLGLIQYYALAVPSVRLISEERIRAKAMVAVEDAALATFTSDYSHQDFVHISRDDQGNITLIQANTLLIHSLVRIASVRAHENLLALEQDGIQIPFGAFTGVRLLAGYGPDITLRTLSVGIIETHIESEFFSAGINQTQHNMILNLTASVTIIMPGLSSQVEATIPVPIIESTIVGRVPDVFFQNDLFNRSLNLVP